MTVRFLHRHERDPAVVEEAARFAIGLAGIPSALAVQILRPAEHDYPSGVAYTSGQWPQWARLLYRRRPRDSYALTVRLVTDDAPVLGQPHVCWHATRARDEIRELPEGERAEYQPLAAAAVADGQTMLGRWPIYTAHDWIEALVHTAAHEASHIDQSIRRGGVGSEVICERFAAYVLRTWRER